MRRSFNSTIANVSLSLMMLLLVSAAAPGAFAQDQDDGNGKSWGGSFIPLVYNVENTGAHYPAPNFPDFGHLPIIRPLPDAFRFANGWRDTSFESWERRRNEIKAAIEKYEIGTKPDCHDCTITATYTPAPAGSDHGSLAVVVTRNGKSLTLNERVWLPPGMGNGPFPAVIAMSLAFPPFFVPGVPNYGSLPAAAFAGLPVATIDFFHNDVSVYKFPNPPNDNTGDPFYQLYPELCAGKCTGTSNSGQYAAWSWGVSRLIDGIIIASHQATNPLPIDVKHLAVTGCSYAGKMALFAGALDERVALTIAQENGGGGAPSWRVSREIEPQQAVEDINDTNYDWFAQTMKQFSSENVFKLPTDHDELMAMVAPRALLETGNTDFYWLSNRSNYVSARATQKVYKAFGIGDRYGFYIDGAHNHCATLPAEAPVVNAYVEKFLLGNTTVSTDVEVFPTGPTYDYSNLDYKRWTSWWGGNPNHDPKFPNNWNTGGTVVMALNTDQGDGESEDSDDRLRINTGDTVQVGYQLKIPIDSHPAATVSLTNGNIQADVRCFDGSSYTLTIPLPATPANSIAAGDIHWVPGKGTFQGSATAPGCSSGVSQGSLEGAYFSALNVSTSVGNPPTGTGFMTTDTTDPLKTRFGCSVNGDTTNSQPLTVNFQP